MYCRCLREQASAAVEGLLAHHKRYSPGFDLRDTAIFTNLCLQFSQSFLPCMVHCLGGHRCVICIGLPYLYFFSLFYFIFIDIYY